MLVMTYNIRTQTKDDGPNEWKYRADDVGAMIRAQNPDLVGFQEVKKVQLEDLIARLPGYTWYGIGREDGLERGEYSPLFWRADRFDKLETGSFWLSADCTKPCFGWDAACIRIASWAALRERRGGRELIALNVHTDHMGATARHESAKLITAKLTEIAAGRPRIVTGDFNATPDTPAYAAMLEGGLRDARTSSLDGHTGPIETFPGWLHHGKPPKLIDYIFVSPDLAVRRTETLPEMGNGRQLSDHRALVAEIE